MNHLMGIVTVVRNIRAESGIKPKDSVQVVVNKEDEILFSNFDFVSKLAKVEKIEFNQEKPKNSAVGVAADLEIAIPLEGLVDRSKEKEKLEKEAADLEKYLKGLMGKLNNEKFLNNAPAEVVESEKKRSEELTIRLNALKKTLGEL